MRDVRFEVDGESVAGELWEPPGTARGNLVLVHGFLSQRTEFARAPEHLAARGWRVLAVDQRGFGASGGPRGILTIERAVQDVLAGVAWMRAHHPGEAVGLVGHSMGTLFTLEALARDGTIAAAVVASPMSTVRAEVSDAEFVGYRVAHSLHRLKRRLGLGPLMVPYKNRYARLFHDSEAARRAEEAGFLVAAINFDNYEELLTMDSRQPAMKVKQPVLVLVAKHDRAVKRTSSMAVYEALAGPKELVSLECGHSLFGDVEWERAVAEVDRWMQRHLPRRG